jgi:hypothetical protein
MIDIDMPNQRVGEVLKAVADLFGISISAPDWLCDRSVTFHLKDVSPQNVVLHIAKAYGLMVQFKGDEIIITGDRPNQALLPTPMSVTHPAAQAARQP